MPENSNNVIQFPADNRRLDLSNIATDPEEVMEKIHLMKKAYFADVADSILDDVLRSIGMLDLEDTKFETFPLESQDQILIKEAVIAAMCRVVGIEHPLHELMEQNLIQQYEGDVDSIHQFFSYKFKSEEVSS